MQLDEGWAMEIIRPLGKLGLMLVTPASLQGVMPAAPSEGELLCSTVSGQTPTMYSMSGLNLSHEKIMGRCSGISLPRLACAKDSAHQVFDGMPHRICKLNDTKNWQGDAAATSWLCQTQVIPDAVVTFEEFNMEGVVWDKGIAARP